MEENKILWKPVQMRVFLNDAHNFSENINIL